MHPQRLPAKKYVELMRRYTQEYFERLPTVPRHRTSLALFKQKGSNMTDAFKSRFERFHLNFLPVDFADGDVVPLARDLTIMMQKEAKMLG